jgi:hypothetical protein
MSIRSLTTIGAVRDVRAPLKQDVGAKPKGSGEEAASLRDLLVAQVPTEMVAPYTAVTAAIVGAIATPTVSNPNPSELEFLRWLVFGVMVAATFALVWIGKSGKAPDGTSRFPVPELIGATAAAAGWGLAMPGSPLTPYLDDATTRAVVPVVIAFVAVIVTLVTAAFLKKKGESS